MPKNRPVVASKVVRAGSGQASRRVRQRLRQMAQYYLSPTETSERDIIEWLGWFYRFHTDPEGLYIPYALCTVDCMVAADGRAPVLHRCVREVVKFNGAQGVAWKLVTWVPGLPGVQSEPYETRDEAMTQMARPPQPVWFVLEAPA